VPSRDSTPALSLRILGIGNLLGGLVSSFYLISEATRRRIDAAVPAEELPAVRVKGRAEDVNVYKVA
jgi:hypothetical protein